MAVEVVHWPADASHSPVVRHPAPTMLRMASGGGRERPTPTARDMLWMASGGGGEPGRVAPTAAAREPSGRDRDREADGLGIELADEVVARLLDELPRPRQLGEQAAVLLLQLAVDEHRLHVRNVGRAHD